MDERAKEIKEESPIWSNFLSKRARINSVVGPVPRNLAVLSLAVEEIYSLWHGIIAFYLEICPLWGGEQYLLTKWRCKCNQKERIVQSLQPSHSLLMWSCKCREILNLLSQPDKSFVVRFRWRCWIGRIFGNLGEPIWPVRIRWRRQSQTAARRSCICITECAKSVLVVVL